MWLPIADFSDIRPGDRVTVVLHGDRSSFPSTVDDAGYYTGQGSVARGRADVVSVQREYAAPVGTVEGELVEQLRQVHAELDALRGVVSAAATDLRRLRSQYTEIVDHPTGRIENAQRLYDLFRTRTGEIGRDLAKALPARRTRFRRR